MQKGALSRLQRVLHAEARTRGTAPPTHAAGSRKVEKRQLRSARLCPCSARTLKVAPVVTTSKRNRCGPTGLSNSWLAGPGGAKMREMEPFLLLSATRGGQKPRNKHVPFV